MARPVLGVTSTVATPTACPFCQSTAVSSTAKRVDESSYWRCATCGELWNVARLIRRNTGGFRRGW